MLLCVGGVESGWKAFVRCGMKESIKFAVHCANPMQFSVHSLHTTAVPVTERYTYDSLPTTYFPGGVFSFASSGSTVPDTPWVSFGLTETALTVVSKEAES